MNLSPRFYDEPARHLPTLDEADVVVIGSGPGGIGAAIAAARNGARTVLVERFGYFGGTFTSGILCTVMPFPFVKGIFAEWAANLEKAQAWRPKGPEYGRLATYDTEAAKLVLDTMITEAGVIPYLFTSFAAVIREGAHIKGVIVESKEGRQVIWARQVIDASGDGDVCANAGVPFEVGRASDGATQPMSLIFKIDGADDDRVFRSKQEDPNFEKTWAAAKQRGEVTIPREDVLTQKNPRPGQWNLNVTRLVGFDATKVRDVTRATLEARRQVAEVAAFLRKSVPGFENAVVSETAPHIGVRESRRIRCDYTVNADDIISVRPQPDGIARGNWFIDIHSPTGEGTERIFPPEGKCYEIPFRSLRAQGVENLLVASRCVDSTHEAHAAIRITPQVMAIGEAAGTAAALCIHGCLASTRDLDTDLLRENLRQQGAWV